MAALPVQQHHAVAGEGVQNIAQGFDIKAMARKDRVLDGRRQRDGMPEVLGSAAKADQAAALAVIFLFDEALDCGRSPPC